MENTIPAKGMLAKRKTRISPVVGFLDGVIRRAFDIASAVFGLLFLSPIFAVIAIMIHRDSPGPIFYRGPRIGKGGKVFKILKFRTMFERAESYEGSRVTAQGDDRVTPFGKWLRRTKINELPQLWNVLVGNMGLVGPRPEDPKLAEEWPLEVREELLSVRPGITSPASVLYRDEENMLKGETWMKDYLGEILPSKIRLDSLYIRNRSIITDLDVIFWTAVTLLPKTYTKEVPNHLLYWGPASRFFSRFLSWFLVDFIISLVAIWAAAVIWRLHSPLDVGFLDSFLVSLQVAFIFSLINYLLGLNRIAWSKAEATRAVDLAASAGLGILLYVLADRFLFPPESFPFRVIALSGPLAAAGFITARYRQRLITGLASRWLTARHGANVGERVLIVGAGDMGEFANWLFSRNKFVGVFSIVGIVDDDPRKIGMIYNGYHILGTTDKIPELVEQRDIGIIIYAITEIDAEQRDRIMDLAKQSSAKLILLPNIMEIFRNTFDANFMNPQSRDTQQIVPPLNFNLGEALAKVEICLQNEDIAGGAHHPATSPKKPKRNGN